MITLKEFINEGLINIHKNNKRQNKTFDEIKVGEYIWWRSVFLGGKDVHKVNVIGVFEERVNIVSPFVTDKNPNTPTKIIGDKKLEIDFEGDHILVSVNSKFCYMKKGTYIVSTFDPATVPDLVEKVK